MSEVVALKLDVMPLLPSMTIEAAADMIVEARFANLLALPIVQDQRVVGTLSRERLNQIFLRRFGRELMGAKPITQVMNPSPPIVPITMTLEAAVAHVSQKISSPLTEDFVVVDAEGRYLGMGVVIDLLAAMRQRATVTTRRLSEAFDALKRSQAALVQSEKMASLGQMVAGVAHEMNTPLGYVRNNVEMMQTYFDESQQQASLFRELVRLLQSAELDEARLGELLLQLPDSTFEDADESAKDDEEATRVLFADTLFGIDQISELVVNLRNFSRLDQAKVTKISLHDCIEQTLSIAANVLKNRVDVLRRFGDIPPISCSPSQINQVLLNLITNAAQAAPETGGKLLIKTEFDGQWVRISIQDNGRGIESAHLQRIFDPFFTTKPVGQGTGLGLSICSQIVQAHGGSIEVASKVGLGTRFIVKLPLTASVSAKAEPDVLASTPAAEAA